MSLAKHYKSTYASLKNIRDQQVPVWTDIRDYLGPRTARFSGEQKDQGKREDQKIINSSVRQAVRTLPAGMQSGVTSRIRPWFLLQAPDPKLNEVEAVKQYISVVERRMREVFARSNFYSTTKKVYNQLGLYGTGAMYLEKDEKDIVRFYSLPIGSYCISQDSTGRVDTMYREVALTSRQMVQKFKERAPARAREAYDNGDYEKTLFNVCHIVEPNREYKPGSALSKHKLYASIWLDPSADEMSDKAILLYSGYDYKPLMVPRWEVQADDVWGHGCGEVALGDSKQLQLMEKRKLQKLDLHNNPVKNADAGMRNQIAANVPGATNFINGMLAGQSGVTPMFQIDANISPIREEVQVVEQRIDAAFYKNLFLMVAEIGAQPDITATQINALKEEKLQMLGPVTENVNDEMLDPVIEGTFYLMQEMGALPQPPRELDGVPLKVEYVSILTQAQKALGIGNIERFTNYTTDLATRMQSMEPLDKVNVNEVVDAYADALAIPPELVNTDDVANQKVAARSQAAQERESMEMAAAGVDAAKTMSETQVNNGSALSRAMEVAGAL